MELTDEVRRGRPERAGDKPDIMFADDLQLAARPRVGRDQVVAVVGIPVRLLGRRDAEAPHEVLDEGLVRVGHLVRENHLVVTGRGRGKEQVDTVRAPPDLLVEPPQVVLQLFDGLPGGAEHADTAAIRHRRNDISTVAEREDRKGDSQPLREHGFHLLRSRHGGW